MKPLLLATLTGALAVAACGRGTPVSDALAKQVVDGGMIRVASITAFDWDSFYVFSPYTPGAEICSRLGGKWPDCDRKVPNAVGEGQYFLVFSLGSSVVHFELHRRAGGDFCETGCALVLSKEQAVFKVSRIETPTGQWRRFDRVSGHT